ncbi:MAG: hypothetical protein R8G66_32215 [Cytophagales bacterium]|nr:hypothetical protein [Cytophagales bacterium]
MIYLYTSQNWEEIKQAIGNVEGLTEATHIESLAKIDETKPHLIIDHDYIKVSLPWDGTEPPVMFAPIPFDLDDIISIILFKLGYAEQALQFNSSRLVLDAIKCGLQLQYLDRLIFTPPSDHADYFSWHNHAILAHYAGHLYNEVSVESLYEQAIEISPSEEHAACTAKHLAVQLLDTHNTEAAEELIRQYLELALSERSKKYLELDLINVLMTTHHTNLDRTNAEEIKDLIWNAIKYFEDQNTQWVVANLYSSASELTNLEKSYSESLGYISKAITIYSEEELPEFLASAYLRKGTLLYTWAQDGNPQFYQAAIDTFQEAIKTFTREHFPHVFAEIHHNMAVIYAEMPADDKKKAMWSAFSATSFKECLEFYEKNVYPYEYAMVANNYANALLKYPPAKTGDNAEKAVYYYLEALEIRNAENFPNERAHSILNYLEACWRVHNINNTMERARYKDMLAKAREVKELTNNQELMNQAKAHLEQLSALSLAILNG